MGISDMMNVSKPCNTLVSCRRTTLQLEMKPDKMFMGITEEWSNPFVIYRCMPGNIPKKYPKANFGMVFGIEWPCHVPPYPCFQVSTT